MGRREHWEQVYASKPSERLGWYKPHLQTSLEWISAIGLDRGAPVIDIGGGASTLVDDLLDLGYTSITVLDLAAPALELIKARLGRRSSSVTWICGDITESDLPDNAFELWHCAPAATSLSARSRRKRRQSAVDFRSSATISTRSGRRSAAISSCSNTGRSCT